MKILLDAMGGDNGPDANIKGAINAINQIKAELVLIGKEEIIREKVKEFYQGVLGMPVIRSWGEPELAGFMFDTGAGLVEVFTDAEGVLPQGSIRHFALKTDDVDGCVKAVREAGYPITVEPKDVVIPSQPEFPVRVAFCNGPVGEEIEFFQEK